MNGVDDLVTWLRAQLDDDERVAREAGHRALTWSANGTWYLEGVEHNVVGREEAFCHPHNVEHIARHDPARVLGEVQAKREILAKYEGACRAADREPDNRDQQVFAMALSHAVAALALPYVDRPGYRDVWAVTSGSA